MSNARQQPLRVVQLSDTHFLEPGSTPEGGFGYDTLEAFEATLTHVSSRPRPELVVVTGDVADHGRIDQYRIAADAFARFDAPVNVCPGNHDLDASFSSSMGRTNVSTSRVVNADDWCFLFVDSNAGVMTTTESGRRVDPVDVDDRLHRNGSLGARETEWILDMCSSTSAAHVFVWVHHPPRSGAARSTEDAYFDEWTDIIAAAPRIRGFGAGHTHVPTEISFAKLPLFIAPAFKNNFDLDAKTWLPPGYRSYEFAADGSVTSEAHFTDAPQWPRHPMPRSVVALLRGEISFEEFDAIVARRAAQGR